MATLTLSDLDFILAQIRIAEAHAAGTPLGDQITDPFMPHGLRTVDGTHNNLFPGQSTFGAADQRFVFLNGQVWRVADDNPNTPAPTLTNYGVTTGTVYDADPRIISNLIVDQTASNPAAVEANGGAAPVVSPGIDGVFGTADDKEVFLIPNTSPDEGLSAPFNSWMTLFGQFFDHGLDLVNKGGNGSVRILLNRDDPLYNRGADGVAGTTDDLGVDGVLGTFDDPVANFMSISRATIVATDTRGTATTADDIHYHNNQTTPFVDQNQTYTSHASHQAFLREYALNAAGQPVNTGKLLDGSIGGLPTWAEIKAQAATKLGIQLSDTDVHNVPLLRTDAYGNLILSATGRAQLITGVGADNIPNTADDAVRVGNLAAPVSTVGALKTNHAFMDDIAHHAAPGDFDSNGDRIPDTPQTADVDVDLNGDGVISVLERHADDNNAATYDNEMLDAHFITGDGRGNENIGLTAVHYVFHAEHNRQVEEIKATLLASGNATLIAEWQLEPGVWDGERLFQAARFATEMQYQHLVFEEFGRKISPNIDAFIAPVGYDATINPAIFAEFAHVVYRFGHSMLNETVDRYDPNFNIIDADPLHPGQDGSGQQIGLIAAFLNPLAFVASDQVIDPLTGNSIGDSAAEAAGAIVRGMTRQAGNEIDEFVTEALRSNLVGLPLDLAAINIARARETGVPSFNEARRQFFEMTQDSQLKPYESWLDLAANLKHEASVINFIAAYGTHSSITSATTLAGKRAAALDLVFGTAGETVEQFAARMAFLNGPAATTGVNDIDLWIGGLAEKLMPFGGMLGSTFNFVFETQMEKLQNGDRFYYLARTAGMDFAAELENNSFGKIIMRNTDVTHLPGDVFATPTWTLEVDQSKQFTGLGADGRADPTGGQVLTPLVIRDNPTTAAIETNYLRYTGEDHIVLGGTEQADTLIAGIGDDTLYGDGGNDRIEGGDGNDKIMGGAGDDIITDLGGLDVIHGDSGNDVIHGGNGENILFGGTGHDFIVTGEDISMTFAGAGNDFIYGAKTNFQTTGDRGGNPRRRRRRHLRCLRTRPR
jgi:Ca2+-binding RTX toxin-like protein